MPKQLVLNHDSKNQRLTVPTVKQMIKDAGLKLLRDGTPRSGSPDRFYTYKSPNSGGVVYLDLRAPRCPYLTIELDRNFKAIVSLEDLPLKHTPACIIEAGIACLL